MSIYYLGDLGSRISWAQMALGHSGQHKETPFQNKHQLCVRHLFYQVRVYVARLAVSLCSWGWLWISRLPAAPPSAGMIGMFHYIFFVVLGVDSRAMWMLGTLLTEVHQYFSSSCCFLLCCPDWTSQGLDYWVCAIILSKAII